MEHWTWNTEYMERGTLESWNIGTLVKRALDMEHWNTKHGALDTWKAGNYNSGTLGMEH